MAGAAPRPEEAADPAMTMLARDSASLTALAAALAEAPRRAGAAARGRRRRCAWPVAGTVLQHFDEPDAARVRRPGIVVGAAPRALVTAPADALVRYAGPFLEYGYVVVLEPDAGDDGGAGRARPAAGARPAPRSGGASCSG